MAGYGDTYDVYRALTWNGILCLRAYTKTPPPDGFTGHDGIYPSYADMHAWAQDKPDGNLALRLTDDIIGLDVDDYDGKTGGKTLAEAEKRWGALPPTFRSTSRTDGVSGIRLFRVPPGTVLRDRIKFPELGLGGIEIIQRHHRYVMAWPSHHDKTKLPYRWYEETAGLVVKMDFPPSPANLPDLPDRWIRELSVTNNGADLSGGASYDVNLAFTDGQPSDKVAQRLTKALGEAAGQNRHDDTRDNVLALLRYGKSGELGVKFALIALRAAFIATVTDGSRTEPEASYEFERMVYGEQAAKLLGAKEADPGSIAAFFQFGGGGTTQAGGSQAQAAGNDTPRLWWANDLKPAVQPRWLAKNRLPRGAVSLLIGDEGIGKSLLWVLIVAAVTTGKPVPEFGMPARAPGHVVVAAITEDDWQTVVLPRLIVAGADTSMVRVICTDDDGSGAPTFPANMDLITKADPKPDLVVVDAWLDTVPAKLQVRDTQQARTALHPWKDAATVLDAALLLLCHTNRVDSGNARDRYGATAALRQKTRMTLFAQTDENGNLAVGPEKANSAAAANATLFTIDKVQHFTPTEDDDGIVAKLRCAGEATKSARQLLADTHAAASSGPDKSGDAIGWLAIVLANGARWTSDIYTAAELVGHSKDKLRTARKKLNVRVDRETSTGPWYWALPQHVGRTPDGTSSPLFSPIPSGKNFFFPGGTSTSQDSLMGNGETCGGAEPSGNGPADVPSDVPSGVTEPRRPPPYGPGRCPDCGWNVGTHGHAPHCQQTTKEEHR